MVHHYVKQGFKIALDDFGAGHSGLVTLVALTPQFLKLDRELIRSIECNPYKQQLVKAIGSFAQNVDTRLIAEGVETSKELETLMELGIRYVQGFLLAHPRPEPARFSSQMWDELCGMRGKRRKRSSRSWLDMGYGSAAARLVSSAPMLLPFL
jgi:EAL domain-containing protein (putative c-di-GMP-specific phosphodiesterase class I)